MNSVVQCVVVTIHIRVANRNEMAYVNTHLAILIATIIYIE